MTTDLNQAVQGVYNSSREIMKNKQRHLYINMLDLLTRTTRASGASPKVSLNEDYVKFWYNDILPLVFDEEKSIQEHAIVALETVQPYLEGIEFQNLPEWPKIKEIIVEQYSKKLHDLRQASISNWYKIWCILVRILNKEILKGASVINTFLSIVELGFRSTDYNIRADAFLCWKVLVEIFARHNEIFAPKRIKLICIPLKSSQSKTLETSVNKFKVWWYFLCKLAPQIEDYLDNYESFLVYCFGPACKEIWNPTNNTVSAGQGKMYAKVKQMAIACLIESMGGSTKDVAGFLNTMGLERLSYPLITKTVMSKCGKMLVNACFEATIMGCDTECKFGKQIETLWKNFGELLFQTGNPELYNECFKNLSEMSKNVDFQNDHTIQQAVAKILDVLSNRKRIPFGDEGNINTAKLSDALISLLEMLNNGKVVVPINTLNNIAEMCSLTNLTHSPKYWLVSKSIISFLLSSGKADHMLTLILWKSVAKVLTEYLKQNLFEFRINDNAKILNELIMWPMQSGVKDNPNFKEESTMQIWKILIEASSNAEGKSAFAEYMIGHLQKMYEKDGSNDVFIAVLGYYILALDTDFELSSKPTAAFELITKFLANVQKYPKGSCTGVLDALTAYLAKLQETQIIASFQELKMMCAAIIERENIGAFAKHSVDNFKRTLQDKLKSDKAKEKKLLKEIKDLMKNDSQFVIIPTVWSMNPDKLTDHQKEKMKEKRNDIPALYNDITQSQDSSIKPWTPKKIVIAKSKDSDGEIVIENHVGGRESPILLGRDDDNVPSCVSPPVCEAENVSPVETRTSREASPSIINEVPQISEAENNLDVEKTLKNKGKDKVARKKSKKDDIKKDKISKTLKEGTKILDKLNIKVDKKNATLLRQLKAIAIDTVEGNTVVEGRFRERRSMGGKEEIVKNNQKHANPQQTTVVPKRKRGANDALKKKDEKTSRKSLIFENENADKPLTPFDELKLGSVCTRPAEDSAEEVIEASQTSESVLSKKVTTRKSVCATINNNNIVLNSANKNLPTINGPQTTSLSPQKENSSPNVEEIITETPSTRDTFKSPPLLAENSNNEKSANITEQNLEDADTEPVSIISKDSFNCEFLKPSNITLNASTINLPKKSVQIKISKVIKMPDQNTSPAKAPAIEKTVEASQLVPVTDLMSKDVSISEQDTQPTTQVKLNCASVVEERASLMEESTVPVAEVSLNEEVHNGLDVDCSIRSSPECKDAEERNSEFLNDTINISPIPSDQSKQVDARRNSSEQDKTPSSPIGRKLIKPGLHLQISPPERKPTNNSESPAKRPKHVPQLTGRGAQLINMIRNRRIDSTPKPQNILLMTAKTDDKPIDQTNNQQSNQQPTPPQSGSPPKKDIAPPISTPQSILGAPNNLLHKDLLVFSKILPSPYASPSASILKRKIHRDSLDEIESPASKRKRVSFHDPPVSVTKEYVKDTEEHGADKPSLNRCLLPDRTSTPNNTIRSSSLKRKGRADSMLEIAKYSDGDDQTNRPSPNPSRSAFGQPSVEMDSLKWNNTSNDNGQGDLDERCLTPSPSLYFPNEEAVLKHVMEKYQLDVLFEKYTEGDGALTNKSIRQMTNKLCAVMKQDPKVKSNVLDILSEHHPREFLDHAVQENLSFVVCDRLNFSSIVEFVCEKSKLNEDCRRTLLERIQSLLNIDKLSGDAQQLVMALLKNHKMSSEEIVSCLKLITDRHLENQQMSTES